MKCLTTPYIVAAVFAAASTAFGEPSSTETVTPREKTTLRDRMTETFASVPRDATRMGETVLSANKETVLDAIKGNSIALEIEIDPQEARWVQVSVLRSPGAEEETIVRFYNFDRRISIWYAARSQLVLDTTYSSQSPDARIHPPQQKQFSRRAITEPGQGVSPAEPLKLQVLVDRNIVGVIADEKPFMAARVMPERADSVGVSLRACGQDAVLKSLKAWHVKPIRPKSEKSKGGRESFNLDGP